MRLYLIPSAPALALVCAFLTSATLAMEKDLPSWNQFNTSVLSSAPLNDTFPHVANPSLFSEQELMNIEIGWGVIVSVINHKKEIHSNLTNPTLPLADKMHICWNDFGTVLYAGSTINSDAINEGMESYCRYIKSLSDIYALSLTCAHNMLASITTEQKQYHHDNLYYILSYEAKHFRNFLKRHYTHQIPEHSQEDNFYQIICSLMCETATKEFDILNEYIIFESTGTGNKKQIDNGRLFKIHQQKNVEMINTLSTQNPVFCLNSVNTTKIKIDSQISKLVNNQVNIINDQLQNLSKEMLNITNNFSQQLNTYNEKYSLNRNNDIISMYRICGPWILNTINAYNKVTDQIKIIEKTSIEWLKNFKTAHAQLFRKLSLEQKNLINNYLKKQDEIEREKEKSIELEKKHKARLKSDALKAKREIKANKRAEQKELPSLNLPKAELAAPPIESEMAIKETILRSADIPVIKAPEFTKESVPPSLELTATEFRKKEKKVKIKTRPQNSVDSAVEAAPENISEKVLPEKYRTEDFTNFIQELIREKNERKVKNLFKQLSSVYEIESETGEERNKGYFAVRSPITNKLCVRTYHHLHVDHPYASIFMALHDVLVAADIVD